jgi:ATP-dependent protease ClpP protease subunit
MGSASQLSDNLEFTKRLQTRLLEILASRSKMSVEEIAEKWERRDWWLDATEAHDLGFVDEITR